MTQIPEGKETAIGEGDDLRTAIQSIAESLNTEENLVHYKLDLAHFRSNTGISKAQRTVKIIGWVGDEPRKNSRPAPQRNDESNRDDGDNDRQEQRSRGRDNRRDGGGRDRGGRDNRRDGGGRDRGGRDKRRDRDDRRERGDNRRERGDDRRGLKGPEEGTNEASELAQEWFQKLLGFMDIDGEIVATGSDERVHIRVNAKERAGRLIGRRGSTLASIRQILSLVLEKHGSLTIDVDVEDNRKDEGPSRDDNRDQDDRRGGDKRGGRERRDRDSGEGKRYAEDKLRALARRAAEKAIETQRTITINLDLNSYDRRMVHLEIAEIEGVKTVSEEKDGRKVVQVVPE